jgi:hypothetical protein
MKYVHCHLPHYNAWVIGLIGWPSEKASEFLKKKHNVHDEFCSGGRCVVLKRGNETIAIVHLKKFKNHPEYLALLVHEVAHACLLILNDIGQGVCTKDHEHFTYMVQHVFQSLLTERLKHK